MAYQKIINFLKIHWAKFIRQWVFVFKKYRASSILFLVLFILSVTYFNLSALAVDVRSSVTITNVDPEVISVYLSDTSFNMDDDYLDGTVVIPQVGTSRQMYFNGIVQDDNTAEDIVKVSAVFYRSGVASSSDCAVDNNNCFRVENCDLLDKDKVSKQYSCGIEVECNIDTTDGNGDFPLEDWRAEIRVDDPFNGSGVNTNLIKEVESFGELCNGLDDDCNDKTDDGFEPIVCGLGVCENTIPACTGGEWQTCVPLPHQEMPEISCKDVLDNDCNGFTDVDDDNCYDIDWDTIHNDIEYKLTEHLEALTVITIGIADDVKAFEDEYDNTIITGSTAFGSDQIITILPPGTRVPSSVLLFKSEKTKSKKKHRMVVKGAKLAAGATKSLVVKWDREVCIIDKPGDIVVNEEKCVDEDYQRLIDCDGKIYNFNDFPDSIERNFQCNAIGGGFMEVKGLVYSSATSFKDDDNDKVDNDYDICPNMDDEIGCGGLKFSPVPELSESINVPIKSTIIQSGTLNKDFGDGTFIQLTVVDTGAKVAFEFDFDIGPIYADFWPDEEGVSVPINNAFYIKAKDKYGYIDELFRDMDVRIKTPDYGVDGAELELYYLDTRTKKWRVVEGYVATPDKRDFAFLTRHTTFALFKVPAQISVINTSISNRLAAQHKVEYLEREMLKDVTKVKAPYYTPKTRYADRIKPRVAQKEVEKEIIESRIKDPENICLSIMCAAAPTIVVEKEVEIATGWTKTKQRLIGIYLFHKPLFCLLLIIVLLFILLVSDQVVKKDDKINS